MNDDGTKLAAADDDGRIRIVSVGKKDKSGVKAFRAKHENIVTQVEWVKDAIIGSVSADQTIKSWGLRNGFSFCVGYRLYTIGPMRIG